MKRKNIVFILLFFFITTLGITAAIPGIKKANKVRSKIEVRETAKGTRSDRATQVNAYANGQLLTVEIANYTGAAQVEIIGSGGTQFQTAHIVEAGVCVMDISAFSTGVYTVHVLLGNTVYEGSFEKL